MNRKVEPRVKGRAQLTERRVGLHTGAIQQFSSAGTRSHGKLSRGQAMETFGCRECFIWQSLLLSWFRFVLVWVFLHLYLFMFTLAGSDLRCLALVSRSCAGRRLDQSLHRKLSWDTPPQRSERQSPEKKQRSTEAGKWPQNEREEAKTRDEITCRPGRRLRAERKGDRNCVMLSTC